MSKLGSLYIQLGDPEGELTGCCETAEWAAGYIEFLRQQLADRDAEIERLQEALHDYKRNKDEWAFIIRVTEIIEALAAKDVEIERLKTVP